MRRQRACFRAAVDSGGRKHASPRHRPTAVNPVLAKAVPTPEIEAMTKAVAALGPHKQANLPPIPFRGYAPPGRQTS